MSTLRPDSRRRAVLVGLAWGLFWGLLVPLTPLVALEQSSRDWLARLQNPTPAPASVVILGIDGRLDGGQPGETGRRLPDFYLEPATYAALLNRLIGEAKAKAVLLTLPDSFNKYIAFADEDRPLREAITRFGTRVVLEAIPANGEVDIFNNLLPYGDNLLPLVPPERLVGVRQFLGDSDGIVRRTRSQVQLKRADTASKQLFSTSDFLVVRKFLGRVPAPLASEQRIHFFGPQGSFAEYPVEQVCPPDPFEGCGPLTDRQALAPFAGKLVIVGHTGDHPESAPVETPFGRMDTLSLHANIVGDLLTGRIDRTLTPAADLLIVLGFSLASGWCFSRRGARRASLALLAGFVLVQMVAVRSEPTLLLPVVLPLAAFVSTGGTLFALRTREKTLARLAAQEEEINRLRRAEREAVLNQARKLLFRVATDIHDRPLQELKLVMDQLEELLIALPDRSKEARAIDDAILALQSVGRDIRTELNDLREVANKLEITPALKEGLHAGLAAELDRLVASGELRLAVERQLAPLAEPPADSRWLDAREDIFRFFKEALVNVIRHAQPHGATQLRIRLAQTGEQAELHIENDGPPLGSASSGGGYGTKVMNTIAGELPGGEWERTSRPEGGVHVRLGWRMVVGVASAGEGLNLDNR